MKNGSPEAVENIWEKRVKDRIFTVKQHLGTYVIKQQQEGVVVNYRRWTPEHEWLVVNALVKGTRPYEFRAHMRTSVEFHKVVDDSGRGFEVMYERERKQATHEEHEEERQQRSSTWNKIPTHSGEPKQQFSAQRPQGY